MVIARPQIDVYEEIIISDKFGLLMMRSADGELLDAPFEMHVQFAPEEIEQAFTEASRVSKSYAQRSVGRYSGTSYDPLREIGSALYNSLFEGRRHVVFNSKVAEARQRSEGVRLNFELESERFADLPWEILHDSHNFISLSSTVQIARRLPNAATRSYEPLDHINVLVISLNASGSALIEQIQQMHADERELLPAGSVQIEVISAENLPHHIGSRDYDLLHVISGQESERGNGTLYTEQSADIPMRFLQRSIATHQPRLIVLQTADSDRSARALAPRSGAVVTVRSNVSAKAKVAFANGMYRSLFTEHSIDQAVAAARQQIDLEIPGSREWGLPRYYRPPVARLPLLQVPERPEAEAASMAADTMPASDSEPSPERKVTIHDPQRRRLEIRLHMANLNLNALNKQASEYRSVPAQLQQQIEATQATIAKLQTQLN